MNRRVGVGWGGSSLTKRETFTFVNDSRQVASSAEDAVLPSNLFRGREKKKKRTRDSLSGSAACTVAAERRHIQSHTHLRAHRHKSTDRA